MSVVGYSEVLFEKGELGFEQLRATLVGELGEGKGGARAERLLHARQAQTDRQLGELLARLLERLEQGDTLTLSTLSEVARLAGFQEHCEAHLERLEGEATLTGESEPEDAREQLLKRRELWALGDKAPATEQATVKRLPRELEDAQSAVASAYSKLEQLHFYYEDSDTLGFFHTADTLAGDLERYAAVRSQTLATEQGAPSLPAGGKWQAYAEAAAGLSVSANEVYQRARVMAEALPEVARESDMDSLSDVIEELGEALGPLSGLALLYQYMGQAQEELIARLAGYRAIFLREELPF